MSSSLGSALHPDFDKFFKDSEFNCKCGKCGKGIADMQQQQISMLVEARKLSRAPFSITSAVRCEAHNKKVGGEPNSAHTRGFACDIVAQNSPARFQVMRALIMAGFRRIGSYSGFIHCDTDPTLPKDVMWKSNK